MCAHCTTPCLDSEESCFISCLFGRRTCAMGSRVVGARPPSQAAYYVALAGVVFLLLLLCCYFLYYFISKVIELSSKETLSPYVSSTPQAKAKPTSVPYPVQPGVRDTATAMAKICKQIPQQSQSVVKGDTVFPTSTSPEAQKTSGDS